MPSSIPDAPGAYLFRDADGRVVYVGKARSLRKRLVNYWGRDLHPRTEAMIASAASRRVDRRSDEVDALMLEFNLIQEHRPRFNVRYRDDKSYPYLALTVGERWPRAQVLRGSKRKNVRYFGPFGHAYAIRETLDALHPGVPGPDVLERVLRPASPGAPPVPVLRHRSVRRPVRARGHRGATEECYRAHVEALGDFLAGNERPVLERLEHEMHEASEREEFELAAKLRDQLAAARRALESQEMVLTQPEDLDVIGPRRGRPRGGVPGRSSSGGAG